MPTTVIPSIDSSSSKKETLREVIEIKKYLLEYSGEVAKECTSQNCRCFNKNNTDKSREGYHLRTCQEKENNLTPTGCIDDASQKQRMVKRVGKPHISGVAN